MNTSDSSSRPKIAFVVTSHVSWLFFEGQIDFLRRNGFDVDAISGPGPRLENIAGEGASPLVVPMEREIAPLKDIVSLARLWLHFRRNRPDLVISGTPKAGLLATIAARLAGVHRVVYVLHGLRLETARGPKRALLSATEWIACHAAHEVRCVSPSLRTKVVSMGLAPSSRCSVVGPGTVNGVDTERWQKNEGTAAAAITMRGQLDIPAESRVIGFVGRLTRDKGIPELYQAFGSIRTRLPDVRLLLVGDCEDGDPVPLAIRNRLKSDPSVIVTGFVADVAPYYWNMDVLAFPSHREGFPCVPLEAQAASVPVVCSDATGAFDAIVDGITGIRVPAGDVDALTNAISKLLIDPDLRVRMGKRGQLWVEETFKRETVWNSVLSDYLAMIERPPGAQTQGAGTR